MKLRSYEPLDVMLARQRMRLIAHSIEVREREVQAMPLQRRIIARLRNFLGV